MFHSAGLTSAVQVLDSTQELDGAGGCASEIFVTSTGKLSLLTCGATSIMTLECRPADTNGRLRC